MVTALWGPVRFRFQSRDPKRMQKSRRLGRSRSRLILVRDSEEETVGRARTKSGRLRGHALEPVNRTTSVCDEGVLQTPNRPAGTEFVLAGPYLEGPCHYKLSCASTSPRTVFKPLNERRTPRPRELLLRHAVQRTQDALAALKQSRAAGARARDSSR